MCCCLQTCHLTDNINLVHILVLYIEVNVDVLGRTFQHSGVLDTNISLKISVKQQFDTEQSTIDNVITAAAPLSTIT